MRGYDWKDKDYCRDLSPKKLNVLDVKSVLSSIFLHASCSERTL